MLSTVFVFLFMDDPAGAGGNDRVRVLAKLVAAAVVGGNATVLHCAGVWMHQQVGGNCGL